jgi:hypothetical protein
MRISPDTVSQVPGARKIAGVSLLQPPEIMREIEKDQSAEHFYLTVSRSRGYFAGSPPSGCGGKEAASAIPCGIIVDSACTTWGRKVDSARVVKCLVGGMLWH